MNSHLTAEQVKEILRKEEEKRRRDAKRREEEIIALMTEQENEMEFDRQGKLWGEESISAMANGANGGDGVKWETDYEAKLVSHRFTPERALIVKQAFSLSKEVVLKHWTEKQWLFFLTWLDNHSWEELALETDNAPGNCVTMVKAMVAKIRERVGSDPEVFPFSELLDQKARKVIRHKVNLRRMLEGKSLAADPENRVYLTPEEKEMPLDALWERIKSRGHAVSRATAHRAKAQGFYMRPGWRIGGSERLYLTDEDKKQTGAVLSVKYGINPDTACVAKKRGYFVINSRNRDKVVRI